MIVAAAAAASTSPVAAASAAAAAAARIVNAASDGRDAGAGDGQSRGPAGPARALLAISREGDGQAEVAAGPGIKGGGNGGEAGKALSFGIRH